MKALQSMLQQVRRIAALQTNRELSDGELLERFAGANDEYPFHFMAELGQCTRCGLPDRELVAIEVGYESAYGMFVWRLCAWIAGPRRNAIDNCPGAGAIRRGRRTSGKLGCPEAMRAFE